MIDAFIAAGDFAVSTGQSYHYCLHRFAVWLEAEGVNIHQVDEVTAARFLHCNEWSNNMRRLYGNAIRSFYRWLYGPEHPTQRLHLPRDDAPAGRWLDYDQVETLIAQFDDTPLGLRNKAIVLLMLDTGLRAAEVCRLEIKHLDLGKHELKVLAKGRKWRTGKFTRDTRAALEAWLAVRKTVARADAATVFVSIGGKRPGSRLTTGGLRALFRRWGERADIGRLSPHDLRRSMATLFTDAGAPTRWVMEAGNWTDFTTFARYTRTIKLRDMERWSPVTKIAGRD